MDLYGFYNYLIYDLGDPRWVAYPLIHTPWPTVAIICVYSYFVKVLGPEFMKNRKPYNIDWIITAYNSVQILWNVNLFMYTFRIARVAKDMENFSLWCIPINHSEDDPLSMVLFQGNKLYFYNKLFDLLDTVFFVFRKKFTQISYVHVYHHILMSFATWISVKYAPGGNCTSVGIINGLVHIVMYFYYQLALMGNKRRIWWKKHLTQLQIAQFTVVLIHNSAVFFQKSCSYNFVSSTIAVTQAVYFIYLFSIFYLKTYREKNVKGN